MSDGSEVAEAVAVVVGIRTAVAAGAAVVAGDAIGAEGVAVPVAPAVGGATAVAVSAEANGAHASARPARWRQSATGSNAT